MDGPSWKAQYSWLSDFTLNIPKQRVLLKTKRSTKRVKRELLTRILHQPGTPLTMQYSSDVEEVAYVVFVHMAATTRNVKKRKKSQFALRYISTYIWISK